MNIAMDLIREALLGGSGGGGGGGGGIDLLVTESLGHVYEDTGTATSTGKTVTVSGVDDYDVLISVAYAQKAADKHYATVQTIKLAAGDKVFPQKGTANAGGGNNLQFRVDQSGTLGSGSAATTTNQGVYTVASMANGTVSLPYSARYHASNTRLIDGDYTVKIYGVKVYQLFSV